MKRNLTIFFTSDTHGYLSPVDYATGKRAATGVANCMAQFANDGNTLIIDGGDTLQGSPLTYFLHKKGSAEHSLPAQILNIGGYDFVTLGNHDFNYGPENLQLYLRELSARCLCANVEGLEGVESTAIVKMRNGLRVGLTGIVTHYVNVWEKPENLKGITITEPIPAAKKALAALRAEKVDVAVCIYHGGFESDLDTGARLTDSDENQGYRICEELGFDVLLTGHQHIALAGRKVFNTYVCQTPDKARQFVRMEVAVEDGKVTAESTLLPAGDVTQPEAWELLRGIEEKTAAWLDTPVGHLDTALIPASPLEMALHGSYIANFFNQVQLEASGADISASCLANEVKGFDCDVTIRDIVVTYVYPNTLHTLLADRSVLKEALERCAEYFTLEADGTVRVSDAFLKPKVEHYNFDYFAGIEVTMDLHRALGDRVTSIRWQGEELPEDRKLTLCMNNYRATGTGGYGCYLRCEKVREQTTEIAELIMDYVMNHGDIRVDRTRWLTVLQ